MAQRITTQRQLYYGVESTEGVEATGIGNSNYVSVTNLVVSPDITLNRRSMLGQMGRYTGKIGSMDNPMLSFTVDCRGGAMNSSVVPLIDPLLQVVLGATGTPSYKLDSGAGTSGAIAALQTGSTTSSLVLGSSWTTGTFTPGNAVAVENGDPTNTYEVGWIQSVAGTTLTLVSPLTMANSTTPGSVIVGARVRPSLTYCPMNSGHGSLTFQMYLDSTSRVSLLGCKGTMKLDAPAPGAIPTITFNFSAMSWLDEDSVTIPVSPVIDSATPPTPYQFKLGGAAYGIKLTSWALRQTVAKIRSQNTVSGTASQRVTDRDLLGLFENYDVDESQFNTTTGWQSGVEQELAHQFGSTQYNMVAYQMLKAQRVDVAYGDSMGATTDRVFFEGNYTNGADEVRLAFL